MSERETLVKALALSPSFLRNFVATIPEAVFDRRRGDGFWTIREHLAHLADVQPMLHGRLKRFSEEEHPEFKPFLPGDDEGDSLPLDEPVETLIETFAGERHKQIELIESFPEDVWSRSADHPEFSYYDTTILVRHMSMHDHWHMYRMEELWITRDEYLTELK